MRPFVDQEHIVLRARVRAWAEANLFSAGQERDDVEAEARRLIRELGREGFTAYTVPRGYGGVKDRVQARDLCVLREELSRGSALANTMLGMQALGSYPITLAGSKGQKSRYLPAV